MPDIEQRELQRLRYRQGQMLRSRDLNDQAVIEDHLRWWHNRAVHNAYGVTEGFEVVLSDPARKEFTIKPGVAYDCFGRELILAKERKERLPDEITNGSATLIAQYQSAASGFAPGGLIAPCPRPESFTGEPLLKWKTGSVSVRDGVPVAHIPDVTALTTMPTWTRVDANRPLARPLARPHIASGSTSPSNTDWRLWTEPTPAGKEFFIGFQVNVDTTDAGFALAPFYFAWMPLLLTDFDEVRNVSVRGFEYRFFASWAGTIDVTNRPDLKELLISAVKVSRLYVCWIGIEHQRREEPEVSPALLATPIFLRLPLAPGLINLIVNR